MWVIAKCDPGRRGEMSSWEEGRGWRAPETTGFKLRAAGHKYAKLVSSGREKASPLSLANIQQHTRGIRT